MGSEPLLDVRDLHVEFRTARGIVHAVHGASLTVHKGQLMGIVGESGSGKSTLARAVIGLVRPPGRIVAGSIKLGGVDLIGLSPKRMRYLRAADVSFVPQNPFGALNPTLRIERQFINVIKAHTKTSSAGCRKMALSKLNDVGIAEAERVLNGYSFELSGGMAQRVVLAIALLLDPQLVIADEPTTGLDVTVQRQILDLVSNVLSRDERSMLLITHDLTVVAQYCQTVGVMYAGQLVEIGPVDAVFTRPAHPYTEALLQSVPKRGQELTSLPGTPPNLIDYPVGCPFYERCPYRNGSRCKDERPPLREVGVDHWAATFCDMSSEETEGGQVATSFVRARK